MSAAGGLANIQDELRDMGIPFDGVVAVYENGSGGAMSDSDVVSATGRLLSDDRALPVLGFSVNDLTTHTPFNGAHPGYMLLDQNRVIRWSSAGHGQNSGAKQAVIDVWEADGRPE